MRSDVSALTRLIFENISGQNAIGFCRFFPVQVNGVIVPVHDPERSGNRGHYSGKEDACKKSSMCSMRYNVK